MNTDPPSAWPSPIDFQDALQHPARCFADPALRESRPAVTEPLGLPLPISGRFANVYHMTRPADGRQWAARVFLHQSPERERRYRALDEHLRRLPGVPSFFVRFDYQAAGIRVGEAWYPLLKMEWVNGVPLNAFVEARLNDTATLNRLAETWRQTVHGLKAARIAHGDLQHDNVFVEPETGAIRLLDYDGAYVPSLAGRGGTHEMGHPSYQHPRRMPADFGAEMDRFPALVIYAALKSLAAAPELWYRLDNGDNLLFQQEDFRVPKTSRAFPAIKRALSGREGTGDALRCIHALEAACAAPAFDTPDLAQVSSPATGSSASEPFATNWLKDYPRH